MFVSRILIFLFISFIVGILSACTTSNIPYYQPSTGSDPNNNGNPNNLPPNLSTSERGSEFLYELVPDTLMALTCPNTQYIGNKHFTLSLGAYISHGLQLSRDFLRNNDIDEDTPYQRVRQLIERSPFKNAKARLALQDETNLNAVISNSLQKQPLQDFFPIFNNPQTLDHLSRLEPVFASRSSSSSLVNSGGRFIASLPISGGTLRSLAPGLAQGSFGQPILTLTYTLNNQHAIFSRPREPYGKGYKLQFENTYKANHLVAVHEEDFVTKQEGEWVCPEKLKFMVHRATRREESPFNRERNKFAGKLPTGLLDEGYCYTREKNLNATERDFFETVFGTSQLNGLPFEIGETVAIRDGESFITDQPCIKFKKAGCYLIGQAIYRIEFDPNKLDDCVLNSQITYRHFSNEEFYRMCPAFLSVCYRLED